MDYIDENVLEHLITNKQVFWQCKPYPFVNIQGFLKLEAFAQLYADLPDASLFEKQIGYKRGHGQQSHDRYALQYRPSLQERLTPSWRDFIGEIHSELYRRFWQELFELGARDRFVFTMHWHSMPASASVSPHTDARRKLGSHIFYFNTPEDWDESWGGQTLVLDGEGKWPRHSAPGFDDLREAGASRVLGNHSFLFTQNDQSWHGVRPIQCPLDRLRKVFIIVGNRETLQVSWRRLRGKDADGYRFRD